MTAPILILSLVTLCLVLLSAALSIQSVREKLIGTSSLRNALIPLVSAGVLWVTALATDLLKGRLEDSTVPEDNLMTFVENITFGLPSISGEFFERDYTEKEVRSVLASLIRADEPVRLTDAEITRLNEIASESGMLEQLDYHRSITTRTVAEFVAPAVSYGFNYSDWSQTSKSWSDFLQRDVNRSNKHETLSNFVQEIQNKKTAAGLFQSMVGMRSRQMLDLSPSATDCASSPLPFVRYDEFGGNLYLTFPTFQCIIGKSDASYDRIEGAKELAYLFQYGCIESLSRTFLSTSNYLDKEFRRMKQYVEEWNQALASKEVETITLRVVLVNVGRFDSFVRKQAKVLVGPKEGGDKITFSVEMREQSNTESNDEINPSSYIQVSSRSTTITTFQAHLPPELQKKLHGAFESEQAYLRLGMVASAGSSEGEIFSQIAPFSSKAQLLAKERVQNINISF